jgi:hypothetical protein
LLHPIGVPSTSPSLAIQVNFKSSVRVHLLRRSRSVLFLETTTRSQFFGHKCFDFLRRGRPTTFRLDKPCKQFLSHSLTARVAALGEEFRKQVIGSVSHRFTSVCNAPLGRDGMPDVAIPSIRFLSPFHVFQKFHNKGMLFARRHQAFYDCG